MDYFQDNFEIKISWIATIFIVTVVIFGGMYFSAIILKEEKKDDELTKINNKGI